MKQHITLFTLAIAISMGSIGQIVPSGLVAYYPFNGNTDDVTSNANHAINSGAVLATDRFGNADRCYYFNGTGAFIYAKSDPVNKPDSFLSVSLWVKAEDRFNRNTPLCKRLFHNADPYNSYVMTTTESGANQKWQWAVSRGTMGSAKSANSSNLVTLDWTHLAGTYDGQFLRLYINGQLADEVPMTGKIGYTDSTLRIGLAIPGASNSYFKGWIDDVRIYRRALSVGEIDTLYSNTTDITAFLPYSEQSGPLVYPNPANNQTQLTVESFEKVSVYSSTGQEVTVNLNGQILSLDQLPNGIYTVAVKSGAIIRREKFIIQH